MKDLERALDDCLVTLRSGSVSIEACLTRYPEHAAQLAPMLRVALLAWQAPGPTLSSDFRLRLRSRLLARGARRHDGPAFRLSLPPLRTAAALITLAVAVLTTGTAFAQRALPDTSLYAWKLTSEAAWRSASSDPLGVDLALSQRRLNEWIAVADDPDRSPRAIEAYREVVTRLHAADTPADHDRILNALQAEQDDLEAAGLTLPPLEGQFPSEDESKPKHEQPQAATMAAPPKSTKPSPVSHLTAVAPLPTATVEP